MPQSQNVANIIKQEDQSDNASGLKRFSQFKRRNNPQKKLKPLSSGSDMPGKGCVQTSMSKKKKNQMYEDDTIKQPEQFNFTFNPKEEAEAAEK